MSRTGNRVRALLIVGVVSLAGVAASAAPAHRTENEHGCNVRLRGLKMLSDPQRNRVNLQSKTTTVPAIDALPQPHPTPKTRSTAFSRRVWRVGAQITEFKLEGDGDIHLVLFGDGAYLIAELPAANCVPKKARDRRAVIAARKKFEARCGQPTKRWQPLGAVVYISGVGFFDLPHTQKPHAPNFAELHPVTAIEFVSGCGA
jgi:hypothetical protein